MRIGISLLSFRPGRIGGMETYLRQLLARLPEVAGPDALVVVLDRDLAAELETPGFERAVVERSARAIVAERLLEAFTPWRARHLERLLAGLRLDVALFPQQSVFPRRAPVRAVLTVADVQHVIHPEHFGLFDRAFRPAIYPFSMGRAERIIAISGHVRDTLVERCAVAPERVAVVHMGHDAGPPGDVEPYPGIGGPYLYYPAVSHPHKNHAALIYAYAWLRASGSESRKLVFTGARTSHWAELRRLIRQLGLEEQVVHLGLLPYEDVRRVFAGADAVVFPSRYEGFGIPVIEAAGLGKKVVASRLPVFEELGVPARWLIDFDDPEQLRAALAQPGPTVLERPPPTWRQNAERTLAILRQVAASPRRPESVR